MGNYFYRNYTKKCLNTFFFKIWLVSSKQVLLLYCESIICREVFNFVRTLDSPFLMNQNINIIPYKWINSIKLLLKLSLLMLINVQQQTYTMCNYYVAFIAWGFFLLFSVLFCYNRIYSQSLHFQRKNFFFHIVCRGVVIVTVVLFFMGIICQ